MLKPSKIELMSAMAQANRRRGRKDRLNQATQPDANPPVWPGVVGGRLKPLSPDEVLLVEEATLALLETLGLSQATPSMIGKVTAAGGTLCDDGRLQFPRALVQRAIKEARRGFDLCGQSPAHDLRIEGARVHMSTGGAAPGVFDIETGRYRPSTLADLYDAARLVDAMENIHHFSRPVVARDVEDNAAMDLNTAYTTLGIGTYTSDTEVRRAYRRLMSRYHPDTLVHEPPSDERLAEAATRTDRIRKAYETVRDGLGHLLHGVHPGSNAMNFQRARRPSVDAPYVTMRGSEQTNIQ